MYVVEECEWGKLEGSVVDVISDMLNCLNNVEYL